MLSASERCKYDDEWPWSDAAIAYYEHKQQSAFRQVELKTFPAQRVGRLNIPIDGNVACTPQRASADLAAGNSIAGPISPVAVSAVAIAATPKEASEAGFRFERIWKPDNASASSRCDVATGMSLMGSPRKNWSKLLTRRSTAVGTLCDAGCLMQNHVQ